MNSSQAPDPSTDPRQHRILFVGKRFYTNKDALLERFGRIYCLPAIWAEHGSRVLLWLIDYHTRQQAEQQEGLLKIRSTPVFGRSLIRALVAGFRLRPTVVVASGDCYVGLVAWLIARLSGAVFVFDIYDQYDGFAGYRSLPGFDLFAFLRRRADVKFFASRPLNDFYGPGEGHGQSVIVPNGVDDAKFAPRDMQECRERLGLNAGDVLIGYFGSMEPERGVGDLVGAIELLRNQGQDIRLLICGKAHPATVLDRDWIVYHGMVAHEQMPYYLGASDLLVLPYRQAALLDMSSSCKIAEYLLCMRPIASTATSNFLGNFPVQASELGPGLCPPGDIPSLSVAISDQLREKRIPSPSDDMSWRRIASVALAAVPSRRDRSAQV